MTYWPFGFLWSDASFARNSSLGFFEQAVAAQSIKAALEAWGADSNLFHQGAAQESTDPKANLDVRIVQGLNLIQKESSFTALLNYRRPVGS
jgi:hypothetical protein